MNENKTSKFFTRYADFVFISGIIYCLLVLTYAIYKIIVPNDFSSITTLNFYIFCIIVFSIFLILFIFLLKLEENKKINLSLLITSTFISIYSMEIFLTFPAKSSHQALANRLNVDYDTRTQKEVLNELNNSNILAYPSMHPSLFISSNGLKSKNNNLFPLGGISNISTIFTNELGYYPIIKTDEHGFNNPKGLYENDKIDIALIGDSFVEGYSVNSNENISSIINKFGYTSISLGKGSNGPLIELATLKEYAQKLKPKIVLWFYYNNDIDNLYNGLKSPILRKYLYEENFSQNLTLRQSEIDSLLIDFATEFFKNEPKEKEDFYLTLVTLLKLTNLRLRMTAHPSQKAPNEFKAILDKANQMVSDWGGKMYFIYLPGFTRYSANLVHPLRREVLDIASELNIPIIDIHNEVFLLQDDPKSLFPFKMYGHYNPKGYRLIAESIINRLKEDNN